MNKQRVSAIFSDVKDYVGVDAHMIGLALKTGKAPVLRWALWIALECARSGRRSALASPSVVSRSLAGSVVVDKAVGDGRKGYAGTSAPTFQRHRAALLAAGVTVDERGRYRLPTGPRWHRVALGALEWLVYHATGPAMRAVVACWVPLSMAQAKGRDAACVTSIRIARAARMGASRSCRAIREARIGGVLGDNRPGRAWTGATRRPPRLVAVSSVISPVPGARFVRVDQSGHINRDTEPKAFHPEGENLFSRNAADAFEARGTPSDIGDGRSAMVGSSGDADVRTPEAGAALGPDAVAGVVSVVGQAGDLAPLARVTGRASTVGRRVTRSGVRAVLSRFVPNVSIGERSIGRLARALPDVADLAWFVRTAVEAGALADIEHAGAWLAAVAEADGAAIRSRKWAVRERPSGRVGPVARGVPAAVVDPAVVAFAEQAIRAAKACDPKARGWMSERARLAAERAGRPDLVAVAVSLAAVDAGQGHAPLVSELWDRAGVGRSARAGAFPAPRGRERDPGRLVLEVADDAELDILAGAGPALWAAWRASGGVTLAAVSPSGARVRLTGAGVT